MIKILRIDQKFMGWIYKGISLLPFLVILSCAAVQAPPGGPVDKDPPELLRVEPADMTTNFSASTSWLHFSEYLDENSTKKAFSVYPALKEKLQVQYKGQRVRILWPKNLAPNRTYILNISKELKDEHGVPLANPIQIAYATGDEIDNGRISGKIEGGKNLSVDLWQVNPDSVNDSIVFTPPDFTVQVSDDGDYSFGYLPRGIFELVAFDGMKPAQVSDIARLKFAVPYRLPLEIADSTHIENVNMIMDETNKSVNIQRLEPLGPNWGRLYFREETGKELISDLKVSIKGIESDVRIFYSGYDSLSVVFYSLDDLLNADSLFINSLKDPDNRLARFNVKNKFIEDTTSFKLIPLPNNYIYQLIAGQIDPINIFSDKPMPDSIVNNFTFSILEDDSIKWNVSYKVLNPMGFSIYPENQLDPEKKYKILAELDDLGKKDSVFFKFTTSKSVGKGDLEGSVNLNDLKDLIVEIRNVENLRYVYRNFVNSDSRFSIENILEGKYTLMIFNDSDGNEKYSNGNIYPLTAGEWFYSYPDTLEIRSNWTIQAEIK